MSYAVYSNNAKKDDKSITLLRSILAKHERVMTDFVKSGDKYPNIDGFLELVSATGIPIGKFEIQVKTLPKNFNMKFSDMPISTIEYAKNISDSPVLFIFADIETETIYWIHASYEFLNSLKIKPNQKQKTLYLEKENTISIANKSYIQDWTEIILSHKTKYQEYLNNKPTYENLRKHVNSALGCTKEYFQELHDFLDIYNQSLDHSFSSIKAQYYPNCWKLGIAVHNYSNNYVGYSIYPISKNENDVQIKLLTRTDIKNFPTSYDNLTQCSHNPIKENPITLSAELLKNHLENFFANHLLSISDNTPSFYNHILFSFLDAFSNKYRFTDSPRNYNSIFSSECDLDTCHSILTHALPYFYSKTLSDKNSDRYIGITFYDPFQNTKIIKIDKSLQEFLTHINTLMIENSNTIFINKDIPINLVTRSIKHLKSLGISKIKRTFIPRSLFAIDKNITYATDFWNDENLMKNGKIFVFEAYHAYHNLLKSNFSQLYDELKISSNIDIYLTLRKGDFRRIGYTAFYSKEKTDSPRIQILEKEPPNDTNWSNTMRVIRGVLPYDVGKLSIYKKVCESLHENLNDLLEKQDSFHTFL